MSIAETWPRLATTPAASWAARNGSATALLAKPATFGRSRLPSSNAGNGAEPPGSTPRIISSGARPLAVIAATNAPALVPT